MKKRCGQSNLDFRLMSMRFALRDRLHPPMEILREAGVLPGMKILDFGCGPGGFSLAAARLVGPRGFVYALDIHPLAVESVRKSAERQGFGNTRAVLGESTNDVPDGQFDMALLYDVLHDLPEPSGTFVELHRVLKDRGVLSVSDRHVREASILSIVTGEGHFRLAQRSPRTFQFDRTETSEATT